MTSVFTVTEAIAALSANHFDIIYLDHDLGEEETVKPDSAGHGMDVVNWMVSNPHRIGNPQIIVHSLNTPARERMVATLKEAGFVSLSMPFTSLTVAQNPVALP